MRSCRISAACGKRALVHQLVVRVPEARRPLLRAVRAVMVLRVVRALVRHVAGGLVLQLPAADEAVVAARS